MYKKNLFLVGLISTQMMAIAVSGQASAQGNNTSIVSEETTVSETSVSTESITATKALSASDAETVSYSVSDGDVINITSAGTYRFTGTASNVTIYVNAEKQDVNIILDKLHVTNTDMPVIYSVKAANISVTTIADSSLTVTGTLSEDTLYGNNVNAALYSANDLILDGSATLSITSSEKGIKGKDTLTVTGGSYVINSTNDAIDVNDSIEISAGDFTITTSKDGFHAENDDDDSLGSILISGGSFTISAGDDGIQATSTLKIDGGSFDLNAAEGMEATNIEINDGTIKIYATDDGINAAQKSNSYQVAITINGGDITIDMGQGDTDAIDSNGNLSITGGTLTITAQSAFDYDGTASLTGGTITVNGQQITSLSQSMMGGGRMGGGNFNGTAPNGTNGGFAGRGNASSGAFNGRSGKGNASRV